MSRVILVILISNMMNASSRFVLYDFDFFFFYRKMEKISNKQLCG